MGPQSFQVPTGPAQKTPRDEAGRADKINMWRQKKIWLFSPKIYVKNKWVISCEKSTRKYMEAAGGVVADHSEDPGSDDSGSDSNSRTALKPKVAPGENAASSSSADWMVLHVLLPTFRFSWFERPMKGIIWLVSRWAHLSHAELLGGSLWWRNPWWLCWRFLGWRI